MATASDELFVKLTLDSQQMKREIDIIHGQLGKIGDKAAAAGRAAGVAGFIKQGIADLAAGAVGEASRFARGFIAGPNIRRGVEIAEFYRQQWTEQFSPARDAAIRLQAKDRAVQETIGQLGIAASAASPEQIKALLDLNQKISGMEVRGAQNVVDVAAKGIGMSMDAGAVMLAAFGDKVAQSIGERVGEIVRAYLSR